MVKPIKLTEKNVAQGPHNSQTKSLTVIYTTLKKNHIFKVNKLRNNI